MEKLIQMNDFLSEEKRIITDYEELKPDLKIWADQLCVHINQLISSDSIFDIHRLQMPIACRIKENKSLLHKAFFGEGGIANASDKLLKITDKLGLRIVVLTEDDVRLVAGLLINEPEPNSIWKKVRVSRILDKEVGDYKAIHLEVFPKNSDLFTRKYLPHELKYLHCEIQIRTLVQHAYSEVKHNNTYKKAHKIDGEVQTMLGNIFGYIKQCDQYFCDIYRKMKIADKHIEDFLTEIAKIYLAIHPSIQKTDSKILKEIVSESNHRLNNIILDLYNINEFEIDDIKEIIQKNKADIEILLNIMDDTEHALFKKEPIVIYLVFLVLTKPSSIKKKWKADDSILKHIYHSFNKAYENE
jgi:putative GTP pyrophosphokinase